MPCEVMRRGKKHSSFLSRREWRVSSYQLTLIRRNAGWHGPPEYQLQSPDPRDLLPTLPTTGGVRLPLAQADEQ